jgi:hypothetical protein
MLEKGVMQGREQRRPEVMEPLRMDSVRPRFHPRATPGHKVLNPPVVWSAAILYWNTPADV